MFLFNHSPFLVNRTNDYGKIIVFNDVSLSKSLKENSTSFRPPFHFFPLKIGFDLYIFTFKLKCARGIIDFASLNVYSNGKLKQIYKRNRLTDSEY